MNQNFITSKDLNLVFGSNLKNLKITGVEIDSRKIKRGNIFFAIEGKNNDGHNFIQQAKDKGAVLALVERKSNKIQENPRKS